MLFVFTRAMWPGFGSVQTSHNYSGLLFRWGSLGLPRDRGGDSDWGTSGEWGIEWGIRCLPDHVILHTPPLILLNQDDVRKNPNQGVKKGECQFVIKVEPKGLDLFY